MPPKNLSSPQTFLVKYILPVLFALGFGTGALSLFFVATTQSGAPVPELMKWMFCAFWIVGSLLIWRDCGGLKKVQADEATLHISNFLREIAVPIAEVTGVSMSIYARRSPVTLHLKEATAFGRDITFLPESDALAFWRSRPDSEAIRKFVRS